MASVASMTGFMMRQAFAMAEAPTTPHFEWSMIESSCGWPLTLGPVIAPGMR